MGGRESLLVPIFAQAAPIGDQVFESGRPILLPIFMLGMMFLVFMVIGLPVWLTFRHAARERAMEHTERMKALELGRSLPGDAPAPAPSWSPARVALGIGAGVPIGVFGIVWLAVLTTGTDGSFAWPAAGGVSLAAVICATILAVHLPQQVASPSQARPEKPAFDPDAYDIAGHHG